MNASPDQEAIAARAALEQAQDADLTTIHDRQVHALATAGFGIVMGVFVVAYRLADGHSNLGGALAGFYVLAILAIAAWQKHKARTVPRNSRRTANVGMVASVILMLTSIIWLNIRQGDNRTAGLPDQVDSWWAYALAAVVTALPMLIAGRVIFRKHRP